MRYSHLSFFCLLAFLLTFCKEDEDPNFILSSAYVGVTKINLSGTPTDDVQTNQLIVLTFTAPVNQNSTESGITLKNEDGAFVDLKIGYLDNNKTVTLSPVDDLDERTQYSIVLSEELKSSNGKSIKSTSVPFITERGTLSLTSVVIGDQTATTTNRILNTPRELDVELTFSAPVSEASLGAISISGINSTDLTFTLSEDDKKVTVSSSEPLDHLKRYNLVISTTLEGSNGEDFSSYAKYFYTEVDPTPKMPVISDEALLTLVQEKTFDYFYDFAHGASGMARERNTSGDLVTSGGSGFGIMALIVGMERNFITRAQGLERMDKILDFLEKAEKFHGAWSHWINGNTGKAIVFGPNDDGGDLVETGFLVEGLITFRQYLNGAVPAEQALIDRINVLWQGVEWNWYRQNNQNVLYWHWSPNTAWIKNLQVRGWNEALIMYILAAASPTHTIPEIVYTNGWARNGAMQNGNSYEGITLPLGFDWGGPLFFTHYSWTGLDPRNLSDQYAASYMTQNVNHSLINYKYCVRNPKNFVGYSQDCWGLTASDNHVGYNAHSPTNDLGVITPTAALSSFPYTPVESMRALKFFYYTLGDRTWGEYGFYDAFNVTEDWYADSYLAIDQGPIVVMIENYRTQKLWNLFMSAPEIQAGLDKLGFEY